MYKSETITLVLPYLEKVSTVRPNSRLSHYKTCVAKNCSQLHCSLFL